MKQVNLGKACLTFGMIEEAKKLHNAGNDAFATLRLWEVLVGMQEDERQQVNQSQTFASEKVEALKQKKAPDVLVAERKLEPIPAKVANEADFPDLIELW